MWITRRRAGLTVVVLTLTGLARGSGAQDRPPLPDDTLITLERTSCFGQCSVYTVSVDATGSVVYEGRQFVRVQGRHTARIAPARVAALVQEAERAGFFAFDEHYRYVKLPEGSRRYATDLPTTFVTIRSGGRSKRVEDYYGAPAGLRELERRIDEETRVERWRSGEQAVKK